MGVAAIWILFATGGSVALLVVLPWVATPIHEGRMQAARWLAFSSTIDVLRTLERAITSAVISPSPA